VIFRYTIDKVLPCIADPAKIRAIVRIDKDFSDLFPYIKGYLKKGIYLKALPSFTFNKSGKIITIYSDSVALAKLRNENEVYRELHALSQLIESVSSLKDTIQPDHSAGKDFNPLNVLRHLPRTNCGVCGEATCLAFAVKILSDEQKIDKCSPLLTDRYKTDRMVLFHLLLESGLDVSAISSLK